MVSFPRDPSSRSPRSLAMPTGRTLRLAALGVFLAANLYLLAHFSNVRRAVAVFWTGSADAVDVAETLRNELYLPISPDAPRMPRAPRHRPTDECLEESLARGGACDAAAYGVPDNFKVDLVWSWVNSTDPLWRRARAQTEARRAGIPDAEVDYDTPISRFDNYDELRYSMRAALENWAGHVRRFHLLAADFPLPAEYPLPSNVPQNREGWRIGQVPAWLAHPTPGKKTHYWIPEQPADAHWKHGDGQGKVEFAVHPHATFFEPYAGTSFSSFGIESQLPNLRGVGDVLVYLNDDMYFLRGMAPADYWSPAYGFSVRAQGWIPVPPTPDPTPKRGEWQPLRQTNNFISIRFGFGTRPYLSHQPKAGSLTIWREFAAVFGAQFRRTRLRQFRDVYFEDPLDAIPAVSIPDPHSPPSAPSSSDIGLASAAEECCAAGGVCCVRGDEECCFVDPAAPWPFGLDPELNTDGRGKGSLTKGDVHTVFGFGHFVMERHREALLWAWLVGKVHTATDGVSWTDVDADRAWRELGGQGEVLRVKKFVDGERETREGDRVKDTLAKAGFAPPAVTKYKHSSLDGIGYIDWRDGWKAEKDNLGKDEQCLMRRAHCFPARKTVTDAFTLFAFERPECGDCAIQALVRASGRLGLSAFLPPAGRTVRVPAHQHARTLPLGSDWRGANFSVHAVLSGGVPDAMRDEVTDSPTDETLDLRAWVLRVLDRYRYVLADTPYQFKFMRSASEAASVVKGVDESDAATVCLNDDIEDPAKPVKGTGNGWFSGGPLTEGEGVRRALRAWQTRRWPDKAGWEA